MLFGFSSLGCPSASLQQAAEIARRHKMHFVELRALHDTCDLPALLSSTPPPEIPLNIRLLATSLHLTTGGDDAINSFLEFAELSKKLNVPYLRVFGDTSFGEPLEDDALHQAAATVRICRKELLNRRLPCRMLLETHGNFSSSSTCLALNRLLVEPIEILWDAHHTWALARESIQETWQSLGPLVRHIHYKDSVPDPSPAEGKSYTLPGEGDYPTYELFQHLQERNYHGGVSLEWEKLWHPELPSLELALESFGKVAFPFGPSFSNTSLL